MCSTQCTAAILRQKAHHTLVKVERERNFFRPIKVGDD
uniref:Uncharacterized protein n=1 Tax=Anguilla anguilla TaxID=7936 RepID=A0A0E9V3L1_ANGAN